MREGRVSLWRLVVVMTGTEPATGRSSLVHIQMLFRDYFSCSMCSMIHLAP